MVTSFQTTVNLITYNRACLFFCHFIWEVFYTNFSSFTIGNIIFQGFLQKNFIEIEKNDTSTNGSSKVLGRAVVALTVGFHFPKLSTVTFNLYPLNICTKYDMKDYNCETNTFVSVLLVFVLKLYFCPFKR